MLDKLLLVQDHFGLLRKFLFDVSQRCLEIEKSKEIIRNSNNFRQHKSE